MATFLTNKQLNDLGVLQQINLALASAGLVAQVGIAGAIRIQDMTAEPNLKAVLRPIVDQSLRANFIDQKRMALRKALGARVSSIKP